MRKAERNTVWALLGSREISNKKHILQAARELFLPCAFTSPQAVNFVAQIFLRLIIYNMQGLNLQILIRQNSCSLQGVLCMVDWVRGREGWVMGTWWLWRAVEDPDDFNEKWASASCTRFHTKICVGAVGVTSPGVGWPKQKKEQFGVGFLCHHSHTTCPIFNSIFGMAL